MTNTQSRILSLCLRASTAAAIAFAATSASAQEFNENGFSYEPSTEVLLAWEKVDAMARDNFVDVMSNSSAMSNGDIAAMQAAFAEVYYGATIDAMMANDVASAQALAAIAQSYIDSMQGMGVDTSRFDSMERDIYVLEELGVMNLEFLDFNGAIEGGMLNAVSVSGEQIQFDSGEVQMIIEISASEGGGSKKVEYDDSEGE